MAINLQDTINKFENRNQPKSSSTSTQPKMSGIYTGTTISSSMPQSNATPAEYAQYLYDSGLQNVFNDYQQNIATLNQQEQQQLQNAYTIREMSKKYLGEYASNMGIGDVSGNLLDIYSQYQQNVGDIMAQSDQLALGLQQTFQQQSEQAFQQALQNQQIQLDENAQTVLFNISRGDLGGQDWSTYLQSALDSGEINETQYQQLFTTVYSSKMEELETNFSRGFFGFKTDTNGERVPMNAQEYLEQNKSWLTPEDYQRLSDMAGYSAQQQGFGFERVQDTSTLNVNLQLFLPSNTPIFTVNADGQTFYYARMNVSVDEDNVSNAVSTSDLMSAFKEENPGEPLLSGQTIYEYNGTFYVYEDRGAQGGATWYRMYNTSNLYNNEQPLITDEIMKDWNEQEFSGKVKSTDYFEYDYGEDTITSKDGLVTWELDGTTFRNNLTNRGLLYNGLTDEEKAVFQEFRRVYNDPNYFPRKHDLIILNGIFYAIDGNGRLQKFKKKA
jgi:hypothetical protein